MTPKILVGVPVYGPESPVFTHSLARLCIRMARAGIVFGDAPFMVAGPYIDQNRNQICSLAAQEEECTHLLFLDHDMAVPADAAERLLGHDKDVVGAWYCEKGDVPRQTAWMLEPFRRIPDAPLLLLNKTGLQVVGGVPMGCTLISTALLRCMFDERCPDGWWFRLGDLDGGEDVYFSKQLAKMGVLSHLDTSLQCGHVGEKVFGVEDWRAAHSNTLNMRHAREDS